jgi:hypothetical protein
MNKGDTPKFLMLTLTPNEYLGILSALTAGRKWVRDQSDKHGDRNYWYLQQGQRNLLNAWFDANKEA